MQSLLKLLVEDDQVLLHTIMILLGCQEENFVENKFTDATKQKLKGEVLGMLEDTASSHLMEVFSLFYILKQCISSLEYTFYASVFMVVMLQFGVIIL